MFVDVVQSFVYVGIGILTGMQLANKENQPDSQPTTPVATSTDPNKDPFQEAVSPKVVAKSPETSVPSQPTNGK